MAAVVDGLPNDVQQLKRIMQEMAAKYEKELAEVKTQLSRVQEQYAALQRLMFGPKSEKRGEVNPKQELLFNEAETFSTVQEEPAKRITVAAHERGKPGRKPFPENLERHEILHELSEAERRCPVCGAVRPELGEERTEELRLIPAKAVVDVHIMKKYGPCPCKDCHGTEGTPVLQAPGPVKLIPGSKYSNGTLAFFLTSKFVDAQPFYRMERILARWGIETGRSTLCALAIRAGHAVGELIEGIREDLLCSPVLGMDETPVQVLHETNRSSHTKSYMWVACGYKGGKKLLFFHYHPSRSGSVAQSLLEGYKGYLQTDGYAGYERVGDSPGIVHVGCMAHIRRKFYEADRLAHGSGEAAAFLSMLGKFYHTESQLRLRYEQKLLDEGQFLTERRKLQEPQLQAMYEWLQSRQPLTAPAGSLGKAVSYALGQWERVTKYLEHALLTPDNNAVENALRPFVIGRKNWLFSNTALGAHTSAGLYSLLETAKANGHEPYKYLCYLFDTLPHAKDLEAKRALLPYNLEPDSY